MAYEIQAPRLPVMMERPNLGITILELTRVPCVGELIFLAADDGTGGTTWRVTKVHHMPPIDGVYRREAIAEILCVPETR